MRTARVRRNAHFHDLHLRHSLRRSLRSLLCNGFAASVKALELRKNTHPTRASSSRTRAAARVHRGDTGFRVVRSLR